MGGAYEGQAYEDDKMIVVSMNGRTEGMWDILSGTLKSTEDMRCHKAAARSEKKLPSRTYSST
jgi:hypothetical protein